MTHVVGIGGTTRPGSSTEKALRYVLARCEAGGASTAIFAGKELAELPFYAPESPERTDLAGRLVEELRRADGVVLASSSYHGSISGLVKNAIDYTEDLRDQYLAGKPVGCVATGAGWQGVVCTLEHLRSVVHALRGWPTPLGAALNTSAPVFGTDGEPTDERAIFQLSTVAREILGFASHA